MPDSATYAEREGAVVYLDERLVEARAAVVVDGRDVVVKRPTAVAFVDREPGVSWGHRCRYLLVDVEIGEVLCSMRRCRRSCIAKRFSG